MTTIKENLTEIKKRLPVVPAAPTGYLTIDEYAERCDSSKQAISTAVRCGRIGDRHLVVIESNYRQGKILYINWNNSIYEYLINRPEKFWPEDFKKNDARGYKPFVTESTGHDFLDDDGEYDPLTDEKMEYRKVEDITSAKYRKEQLAIEKEQVSLQIAKNKAVLISDVVATQKQLAAEIKAALKSFIQRVAPKVTSCNSIATNRTTLEEELAKALSTLEELEGN